MSDEIVIKIEINDKVYPVSCRLGEEERVKNSAKLVSENYPNSSGCDSSFRR